MLAFSQATTTLVLARALSRGVDRSTFTSTCTESTLDARCRTFATTQHQYYAQTRPLRHRLDHIRLAKLGFTNTQTLITFVAIWIVLQLRSVSNGDTLTFDL